ncbi:thiamine pyrophosphate-binding protein [Mycetocola spongiae]|uniref:thiamine pyrophosphate-binding protein n=1 Tax=Mycetocola spongiae TaxID=2859226 RepID=UPI001CF424C7|nr:thiamine pyrophosphate-binding protein [Mycetocola spongiae]UCR88709.1 thiamine pyrophosphate-binding protein [Mycetocola spongiae]
MTSVSALIARTLSTHVSEVFGVMGNGNAHFLNALLEGETAFTAVRHEAAAVAAADGYYRACGRLAAGTVTYGAGFSNTATALAEAAQAGIPVVLVAGDAPGSGPRPWDIDQVALAAALGVSTITVTAENAAECTHEAVARALSERTAVILAIPYDLVEAPAAAGGADPLPRRAPDAPAPDPARIAEYAHALRGAARPLILAGRGAWVSGAGPALTELAASLGALTTTTALARGLFADASGDLGVCGGFGQEAAMALAARADVVLVVGAGMNQFTLGFGSVLGPEARVLRIDDRARPHPRVDDSLIADARLSAEALLRAIRGEQRALPARWGGDAPDLESAEFRARAEGRGVLADGLLDPRSVAARLNRILPADRVSATDGGHFIGWANTYFDVSSPDRQIMVGTAYQSIGLGFPSAVGVARARPEATLVLHTGDGGGLMALADLDSVIRATRRGVIVVWNDAAYGAEVHVYGRMGLNPGPMRIGGVDFAGIARSLGARGDIIHTLEDLDAVHAWLASGQEGVYLLDCRVSPTVTAPFQEEIYRVNSAARHA